MRIVRWVAAAATALMGLMDVGLLVDDGGVGFSTPALALLAALGVVGLVAAVALVLPRVRWGAPLALGVGAVGVVLGVVSVVQGWSGAVVGLGVALVGALLSAVLVARGRRLRTSAA